MGALTFLYFFFNIFFSYFCHVHSALVSCLSDRPWGLSGAVAFGSLDLVVAHWNCMSPNWCSKITAQVAHGHPTKSYRALWCLQLVGKSLLVNFSIKDISHLLLWWYLIVPLKQVIIWQKKREKNGTEEIHLVTPTHELYGDTLMA